MIRSIPPRPAPVSPPTARGKGPASKAEQQAPPQNNQDQLRLSTRSMNERRLSSREADHFSVRFTGLSFMRQLSEQLAASGQPRLQAEHLPTHPGPDASPSARYQARVLATKFQLYAPRFDQDGNGLDARELASMQAQISSMNALGQAIGRVPLSEPAMVSPLLNPVSSKSLTLPGHPGLALSLSLDTITRRYNGQEDRQSSEVAMQQHQLQIQGHSLEVLLPASAQADLPSLSEVQQALAAMPPQLLQHLKQVVVTPQPYRFEMPNGDMRSANMTAHSDGKITVYPHPRDAENLASTFLHELGHIQTFAHWSADMQHPGWQRWQAAMQADGIAPSEYARSNASEPGVEDFAESTVAYYSSLGSPAHEEYRQLFPARFALLDELSSQPPASALPAAPAFISCGGGSCQQHNETES
ncbi:MAG: hypothetical protein IGS03_12765 [Candidatus Sericytochromatia bacterium]|nr:hypothetical protein [Candidatus Sericytochromatia bacterium]